jgi:hypothetical protein
LTGRHQLSHQFTEDINCGQLLPPKSIHIEFGFDHAPGRISNPILKDDASHHHHSPILLHQYASMLYYFAVAIKTP